MPKNVDKGKGKAIKRRMDDAREQLDDFGFASAVKEGEDDPFMLHRMQDEVMDLMLFSPPGQPFSPRSNPSDPEVSPEIPEPGSVRAMLANLRIDEVKLGGKYSLTEVHPVEGPSSSGASGSYMVSVGQLSSQVVDSKPAEGTRTTDDEARAETTKQLSEVYSKMGWMLRDKLMVAEYLASHQVDKAEWLRKIIGSNRAWKFFPAKKDEGGALLQQEQNDLLSMLKAFMPNSYSKYKRVFVGTDAPWYMTEGRILRGSYPFILGC